MWTLIILTVLFMESQANTYTTPKLQFFISKLNSSICDQYPPLIEPETCCDLPNFFNESIVKKCEQDFPLAEKAPSTLVSDSVNIRAA